MNHVTLFTFGFLFYWILPVLAGFAAPIFMDNIPAGWGYFFESISPDMMVKYLGSCILFYFSFAAGDTFGANRFRFKQRPTKPLSRLALTVVLVIGIALVTHGVVTLGGVLFQPYSTDLDGQYARGTVTAYIMLLGVVALLFMSDERERSFWQTIKSPFVVPYFLGSILLLSIGSRLYVATFLLIFAAYKSNFRSAFSRKQIVWGGAAIASGFGLIGALRIGSAAAESLLYVIYEPVLTSLSLVYYLRYDQIQFVNVPTYLISDLSNLIPSVLWPGKAYMLKTPEVYSPLGALNSYVSFNIYFGILGTAALMFALPCFLRYLLAHSSRQLGLVAYVMLSGCLAFTFFRDPVSVSFVKVMLEDSLIFPIAIIIFSRLLQSAAYRKSNAPSVQAQKI